MLPGPSAVRAMSNMRVDLAVRPMRCAHSTRALWVKPTGMTHDDESGSGLAISLPG